MQPDFFRVYPVFPHDCIIKTAEGFCRVFERFFGTQYIRTYVVCVPAFMWRTEPRVIIVARTAHGAGGETRTNKYDPENQKKRPRVCWIAPRFTAINMNGVRYKRAGNPPRTYTAAFDTHNSQSWAIMRARRTRGLHGAVFRRNVFVYRTVRRRAAVGRPPLAASRRTKTRARSPPRRIPRRRARLLFFIYSFIFHGQLFPFSTRVAYAKRDKRWRRQRFTVQTANDAEQNERFSTAHGRDGSSLAACVERLVGSFSM